MRLKQFIVLIVFSLALAGCGGNGILNPFIGTYNGTWTQSNPSDSGTASVIVLPGGSMSGSLHDACGSKDYTVSGTISGSGVVSITLTPSGGTLAGNLGFEVSNNLVGTLTNTGGPFTTMAFTLTPQ